MSDTDGHTGTPFEYDDYLDGSKEALALTRIELAMHRLVESFDRWSVECFKVSSHEQLSYKDVAVLGILRMRGGARNLSEIMMFLNRNDLSNIKYTLKKLETSELIERESGQSRRETCYFPTKKGQEAIGRYAELREKLLVELIRERPDFADLLDLAGGALERLTGLYDQSAQAVRSRDHLLC